MTAFLDLLPFADMSRLELGFWSFAVLLFFIFLRAPIGLAMLLCGFGGWYFAMNGNPVPLLAKLKSETYTTFSSYSLTIIPLFLLMGQFATLSGMSTALFKAAESFLGHRRGGVAMAAVGACAGFGAICGSSLATAATMGKVALPELRRYGYSGGFSTATLAAGGTLGILIPPSVILVLYAIITEQNIAKLLFGGVHSGHPCRYRLRSHHLTLCPALSEFCGHTSCCADGRTLEGARKHVAGSHDLWLGCRWYLRRLVYTY